MLFILWGFILLLALVLYHRQVYSRFKRYEVKHYTPYPLLGNLAQMMMSKKHVTDQTDDFYYLFYGERFLGSYEFTKPMIMICDLDLIKKITVKDFEYFLDHRSVVDENMEPLFGRNLIALKGQEWKDMRSTLSPAFTSSKIRLMVPLMMEACDAMIKSLKKQIQESGVDYVDVECKDLMSRYANDVIATCAFGLKVDSHTEVDNEFFKAGKEIMGFNYLKVLIFLASAAFPNVMKKLNFKLFADKTADFFRAIVLNTMKEREEKNIFRPDMIHLLAEAKKGQLSHDEKHNEENTGFSTVEESHVGKGKVNRDWTDDDLVAQAVLFFAAGFETVSTAMSFLLHELAVHPDIQDRLAQEIKEHDVMNGGKFDFKSIQSMTYMDMVVSEVLRKWPPAIGTDRQCLKDYNLGKPNPECKQDYIVRKGESVTIPTWVFHRNPEYFPEPQKFDPERFSEENKHNIKPFTYMPFGLGPRNCIGSRFALCEIKVMTYMLLQQMELSPGEKTDIPGTLDAKNFNIKIKGGHWVRFKVRQ
ncbi:cytochrome P450 9e2-like [Anticarsia gemmatalis]|uniref:cytochrome P450 9e2-like n=1 Tax=Anticarsia gemmatalis TaxID=129554 RepID=UPI003F76B5FC